MKAKRSARGRIGRRKNYSNNENNNEQGVGNFDRLFSFTKTVNVIHLNHIKENKKKGSKKDEVQIDTSTKNKASQKQFQVIVASKPKQSTANSNYLVHLYQDQKKLSDQKSKSGNKIIKADDSTKLNACCLFCNNRLMIDAVRKNDINQVKKLLSDNENITNPFQPLNCQNSNEDAFYIADRLKNYEIIKLFIKELNSKKERKSLPAPLLNQSSRGQAGFYNFNHGIQELNQGRGSKEGNDAFTKDYDLRDTIDKDNLIKRNLYSLPTLKLLLSERKHDESENDVFTEIQTQVTKYVRKGMVKEAEFLLKYDFDNQINDLNRLYAGSLSDDLPQSIVKISVIKQSRAYNMLSPLHCACINPNPNIIKTLIRSVPQFSLPDVNRRNMIHYAAANHNPDVLKFLLANGADPNELDSMRMTPLMIAADLGRYQNVIALLEHFEQKRKAREQAEKERQKQQKKKVMRKPKNKKKAKKGKKHDSDEDDEEEEENESMNQEGDEERIDVNYIDQKNRSSWTALHFAIQRGNLQCVQALIDAGADVNLKNSSSMTPALIASACGHLEIIKFLKGHQVDFEGKVHKQRKSALIFACMNGHVPIVEYLIDHCEVDINKSDTSKNAPIHYAVAYGWHSVVLSLIQRNADLSLQTIWNSRAPSLAIQKFHFLILQTLIQQNKGAQTSHLYSDADGRDIIVQNLMNFDLNVIQKLETLIKLLNKINLEPNQRDKNGYNAFHYLAGINLQEVAEELYANKKEEIDLLYKKATTDQGKSNKGGKKKQQSKSDDEEEKDEDEEMDNQSEIENNNEDDEDENTNNKQKAKERTQYVYSRLADYVIQIANLLERIGYDFTLVSTNNQSPLQLAAQCKNLPLVLWLLNKRVSISELEQRTKRSFTHYIFHSIISKSYNEKEQLEEIKSILKKTLQKEIMQQLTKVDSRGFTPLLQALASALYSCETEEDAQKQNQTCQNIVELLEYAFSFKSTYEDRVGNSRNISKKLYQEQEIEEIDREKDKYDSSREERHNLKLKIHYNINIDNNEKLKNPYLFKKTGLIDFNFPQKFKGLLLNESNWLHIISEFLVLCQKEIDTKPLINFIQKILPTHSELLTQTNIYMETPVVISRCQESLLKVYLANLSNQQLLSRINGHYQDGDPVYLHLISLIKDAEIISKILRQLTTKEVYLYDDQMNHVLHYACYQRNSELINQVLQKMPITTNYQLMINRKQFSLLDFALISSKNQMELPHIEEQIMLYFAGIENMRYGYMDTCLQRLLKHASKHNFDPINTVKLIIEKSPSNIHILDRFENTLLSQAAKLKNIPLTLAYLYQKQQNKNYPDCVGNNALAHAIMAKNFENALFLLQQNETNIVKNVYKQTHYLNNFINKNGILSKNIKEKLEDPTPTKADYQVEPINIYQLSFENKFFALFHLCKKEHQILLLEGALLAKNFILFNQLLENCKKIYLQLNFFNLVTVEQIQNYQFKDKCFLLHALAKSYQYNEMKPSQGQNDIDEDNGYDNDEDENNQEDEENNVKQQSQEEIEHHIEIIFKKLSNDYKLPIFDQDLSGKTLVVEALNAGNLKFLSLMFEKLYQNPNKKQVLDYLMASNDLQGYNFFNILLKQNFDEKLQLKILGQLSNLLGKNLAMLNQPYKLTQEDILKEYKRSKCGSPYVQEVRVFLFKNRKESTFDIYPLFDLIETKRYEVTSYLIKQGIRFESKEEKQLINLVALLKDIRMMKILQNEAKMPLYALDIKKQSALHYSLSDYQDSEGKLNLKAQNLEVFNYLVENCIETHKQVNTQAFKQMLLMSQNECLRHLFNESPLRQKDQPNYPKKDKKQKLNSINRFMDMEKVEKDFKLIQQQYQSKNGDNANLQQDDLDLIDKISEMQETHEIVDDMNIYLMKVDLQSGLYGMLRFYCMQLLKEKVQDRYILWTRWGRVKETGQYQRTPFGTDKQAAVKEFNKVFKQKTGYDFEKPIGDQLKGKYRVILMGKIDQAKNIRTQFKRFQESVRVPQIMQQFKNSYKYTQVQDQSCYKLYENALIGVIKNNLGNNRFSTQKRQYNQHLTQEHIAEAYMILNEALKVIQESDTLKDDNDRQGVQSRQERLMELCNRYYSIIPTSGNAFKGAVFLNSKHLIESEITNLQLISNYSMSFKLAIASLTNNFNPLKYVQEMLPITVTALNEKTHSAEYNMIMRYLDAGKPLGENQSTKIRTFVSNIYAADESNMRQEDDNKLFNDIHNHWLLWHGTKNENLIGILYQGMKIKPPGVNYAGSLFGNAIYFSDNSRKALEYSSMQQMSYKQNGNDAQCYLLLCEVAIGNVANFPSDWESEVFRPPLGSHSVRIMSEKGPDFTQNVYDKNGSVVPVGPVIKYPPIKVQKGNQVYNDINNFAEYLLKQEEDEKSQKKKQKKSAKKSSKSQPKKRGKKAAQDNDSDEDMEDSDNKCEDDDEVQQFEQRHIDEGLSKHLEKIFMENKGIDKKFDIKPNMISADYLLGKLKKDIENLDQNNSYTDMAQYMVYTEQQVRVRYIVEFTKEPLIQL